MAKSNQKFYGVIMNDAKKYKELKIFIQNRIEEYERMLDNSVKHGVPTGPLWEGLDLLHEIETKIMQLDGEAT